MITEPPSTAVKFAGADWVRSMFKVPLSPLGEAVADILGQVYGGIYHVPMDYLKDIQWDHPHYIEVPIPQSGLATFDGMHLTSLVTLCHDRCVRCQIDTGTVVLRGESTRTGRVTRHKVSCLQLSFSPRNREGRFSARHPTMEEAVEYVRSKIGLGIHAETFPGCKDREG